MKRLLIIEDEEAFRYALERTAHHAGCEVVAFEDWVGVLEELESSARIDAMITDLRLPANSPNGIALARMARLRRPNLRIVCMSAFRDLAEDVPPALGPVMAKQLGPSAIINYAVAC